jgi:hypothetical protein
MSEIGSIIIFFLPAGFFYARYPSFIGEFPKANPAQAEGAHIAAFPSATKTSPHYAAFVFGFSL